MGADAGMGSKPDDSRTIPLCGGLDGHHAEQHRIGEQAFAKRYSLQLVELAAEFWRRSPRRARAEAKLRKDSR